MDFKQKQTLTGKAFEYSIAKSYYEYLNKYGFKVELVNNNALIVAEKAYNLFPIEERFAYDTASKNTIPTMIVLEPGLVTQQDEFDIIKIRLASDLEGQKGDVRDIIFSRDNIKPKWQVGFSAKNNHDAAKHSRLSPTIDFGKEWLDYNCSTKYFDEINKVFDWLKELKTHNKDVTWKSIGDEKLSRAYIPILLAFRNELLQLDKVNIEVPQRLLSYLIGRFPFYKIIKDDKNNLVVVKGYNLEGKLNRPVNKVNPRARTEKINLPTRIIEFDFKEGSQTTLLMVLDHGWQISFRIHSADSKIVNSLKFDITLIGNPPILFTQHLFVL